MKLVLIHKMGESGKKVGDLKKRAEVLQLFQMKLAPLHTAAEEQ